MTNTKRDTSEIPRGSKEFERKLNKAAAQGVQDAIDRASFVDVGKVTEYGLTQPLSRAVRVFYNA